MVPQTPISKVEADTARLKIKELENKKSHLGRELGKIMSSSGSFAAKTPGFPETEDQIRAIDGKLGILLELLRRTRVVNSTDELTGDAIGLYSKVVARDQNNREKVYYICHRPESYPQTMVTLVTPGSPIGQALIGEKIGDVVEISLPSADLQLEIVEYEQLLSPPHK